MKNIDISNLNNIPLSASQLTSTIKEIYKDVDPDLLTDTNEITYPSLFAPTHTTELEEGFEIEVIFRKHEEGIQIAISKFVTFDNEDEWHDAYKRIKDIKDQ